MGLYVNPDNRSFNESINSKIYVDKSMLLAELNSLIGTSGVSQVWRNTRAILFS